MAVSETGQLKALGFICWFSVPDEPVGLRKLKKTLTLHGLPPSLAPNDSKAINVFKRAMREQEGKHRRNGHVRENVVDMVVETPRDCVFQVSSTVRDLEENVIEYPKGSGSSSTRRPRRSGSTRSRRSSAPRSWRSSRRSSRTTSRTPRR
jgi:hypothetical protein